MIFARRKATEPGALAAVRERYARDILARAAIKHPRVEAAFATVPRERYLTPPPWLIFSPGGFLDESTSDPVKLYGDVLVVLDRAKGINNGQPSLHAAWIAAVDPQPGDTAVQIGIGAGYYTAILAELVGEGGRVEAYEIEPHLAAIARDNLASLPQVAVHAVSGVGAELPAADVVYVSAAAPAPDVSWVRCLRDHGRLIFPWQPSPGHGTTMLVRRRGQGFEVTLLMGVAFVSCVGAGPAAAPARGIAGGEPPRALWLSEDKAPDETALAVHDGVWFSSRRLEEPDRDA